MNIKRVAILLVFVLFLFSFPWMPTFFIRIRSDKPDLVNVTWYEAKESWERADYLKAVRVNLQALWLTLDFETRVVISKPFYQQSRSLEKQGQLKEAFDACMVGANIISGKYDPEGVYAYHCFELEMQYNKALSDNESVTPSIEP